MKNGSAPTSIAPLLLLVACGAIVACASSPDGAASGGAGGDDAGASTGSDGGAAGPLGSDGGVVGSGPYAACGAEIVDPTSGTIDPASYAAVAADWSKEAVSCRLGPTYADLHGGDTTNTAPTVWGPTGQTCSGGYLTSGIPVQQGTCPMGAGCYGSDAGQVLFVPTSGIGPTAPGMDRIQTFAWEGGAISSFPKSLGSPEPYLQKPEYAAQPLGQPIAIARSEANWTNDGIAIFSNGAIATAGTPTSGSSGALYRFPPNLHPTAVAITTNSELALVTLWDTQAIQGKLAVFSIRAPTPSAHTWWYHGLYNAGGVRELKFLGTIALPFATPTSISAVTQIGWTNPNDGGGKEMASLSFTGADKTTGADECFTNASQFSNPNVSVTMDAYQDGGSLHHLVAKKGYALVASQWENKVAFVDLGPLLDYFRSMYFGSLASCTETLSQFAWDKAQPSGGVLPQAPGDVWPYTFDRMPASAIPVVSKVFDVTGPRAVRAGWTRQSDVWKAYVAGVDGVLHVYSPGKLMALWSELDAGTASQADPVETVSTAICPHPTAMVLNRGIRADSASFTDLVPDPTKVAMGMSDGVVVVCRGERSLQHVIAWNGQAKVYEEIKDSRMNDPVALWFADRADVRTVADFEGKKVLDYRFGPVMTEDCAGPSYGPGMDATSDFEFDGELSLDGYPFGVSVTNVN